MDTFYIETTNMYPCFFMAKQKTDFFKSLLWTLTNPEMNAQNQYKMCIRDKDYGSRYT